MAHNAHEPQPVDIKNLRRRLGRESGPISQATLARDYLGGINQTTVSRMEQNPTCQRGPVAVLLRKLDAETADMGEPSSPPATQHGAAA